VDLHLVSFFAIGFPLLYILVFDFHELHNILSRHVGVKEHPSSLYDDKWGMLVEIVVKSRFLRPKGPTPVVNGGF
jgi:hypothetical protein